MKGWHFSASPTKLASFMLTEILMTRIASSRTLKKLLSWIPVRLAWVKFSDGMQLAVDVQDVRGPSFHMAHGWRDPERALGSYESLQRATIQSYLQEKSAMGEGLVFLDIGANIGLFTFSLKRALPELRIVAFEPHPVTVSCLLATLERNHFPGVAVERIALSDSGGLSSLFLDESDSGGHSLIASNLWNNRDTTTALHVELMRLDDWVERAQVLGLDFIKMDVQGAEDAVLRGGLGALTRFKPALLIEVQHEMVFKNEAVIGSLRGLPFRYGVRSMGGEQGSYEDLKAWSQREFERGVLFADYLFLPTQLGSSTNV